MSTCLASFDSIKKKILAKSIKKILLISGKNTYYKTGAKEKFKNILKNKETFLYIKNSSLPDYHELKKIINFKNLVKPDFIIAIGGGCVMDYAKICSVINSQKNLREKIINSDVFYGKKVKVLALPTTTGSGAEVTSNAVIYINNIKYSVEDYQQLCEANKCELLNVNDNQIFKFKGKALSISSVDVSTRYIDKDVDEYIADYLEVSEDKLKKLVTAYFEGSEFADNLELDLITTDEDFSQSYERFKINFSERQFSCVDVNLDTEELQKQVVLNGNRFLQIKVRRQELIDVMLNRKPWEDLSIGFQCRIYRQPNVYNSEFWFYFTNVYIAKNVEDLSAILN